jgi:purine-nucleoside phosphorylase
MKNDEAELKAVDARADRVSAFVRERMDAAGFADCQPRLAIICGSGLGGVADCLEEDALVLPYENIPEFPQSSVLGHAGELVIGALPCGEERGDRQLVVCMKGRFHLFEGYSTADVSLPVRVFARLGVECMVVTNAAGALNPAYNVGDFVILNDHVNMPAFHGGTFPFSAFFKSMEEPSSDPRVLSVDQFYDAELQVLAERIAEKLALQHKARRRGVYCFVSGPTFETPTECKFLRMLGGDAVGMSSVPEALVARELGLRVVAMSLITNKVVFPGDEDVVDVDHAQVLAAAADATR